MSIFNWIIGKDRTQRAQISALKLSLHRVEERLFAEMAHSRQLAEDRNALIAQNCRLRAQRDDALARRRDAAGRFSR